MASMAEPSWSPATTAAVQRTGGASTHHRRGLSRGCNGSAAATAWRVTGAHPSFAHATAADRPPLSGTHAHPHRDPGRLMRGDLSPWTIRGAGFALGVAIVVGLLGLGYAAGGVLLLLFIAILLGSALEPMIGLIRSRLPLGRGATILVVYVTFFVTVVGLALIVVPAAIGQGQKIAASLPAFFDSARGWADTLRPAALSSSVTALIDSAAGVLTPPAAPPKPDQVVEVGTLAAEAAVTLATLLTLVFFWLVEHARLQRYLLAYLPMGRRAGARDAWNEIETRLGLWVRGQLTLMGAMGLATGIAYSLLGVPGALLLGLIAALTEAIPIVGPLLGAIPAVLVAATVSPQLAVIVAGVYVVIQLLEGSVLVPLVMRNTVGISPLLILLSLLIGSAVAGIVGAFLAVPVAASLEIILSRLQARETPVAQDPAAIETPDEDALGSYAESLPDTGEPAAG
jgi:predicted PurR-regulated permease PerM